jgi:nitric oxide reductase activation protein
MSGSTSQQLEGVSKRVIDVQKEGLVLLSEALDAIGDEYALYGFSGRSRNQVDCYRIKGFDEKYDHTVQNHIGGIQPLGQNRDGTAIRHITKKLLERVSKIKMENRWMMITVEPTPWRTPKWPFGKPEIQGSILSALP